MTESTQCDPDGSGGYLVPLGIEDFMLNSRAAVQKHLDSGIPIEWLTFDFYDDDTWRVRIISRLETASERRPLPISIRLRRLVCMMLGHKQRRRGAKLVCRRCAWRTYSPERE